MDEFGQPLESSTEEPNIGESLLADEDEDDDDSSGLMGLLNNVVDSTQDVFKGAQQTIGGIFAGGQSAVKETVNNAIDSTEEVIEHGQDTLLPALNPLNFFGAAAGGTLTIGVFVVGGAFAADQALNNGAGTRALFGWLTGRRR